ncbi:MAG: hypothetical protein IE927_10410 [Rhodobacterales bacterium]|nr:hypothetical protein [Rhodobacterales bacterium]
MPLIRPAARAALLAWREVAAAAGLAALGLWIAARGGWLLTPLGLAVAALAAGWAVTALRRMRFAGPAQAPGVVDLDEGQIGYLSPDLGGYVALADLVELRALTLNGRRMWRLRQADGQALLIPMQAAGAEALFDAFASLPGLDGAALVAARQGDRDGVIWRRPAALARLPRP